MRNHSEQMTMTAWQPVPAVHTKAAFWTFTPGGIVLLHVDLPHNLISLIQGSPYHAYKNGTDMLQNSILPFCF